METGNKTFERTGFFGLAVFGAVIYGLLCLKFVSRFRLHPLSFVLTSAFLHDFSFTVLILAKRDFFSGNVHLALKCLSWLIMSIICFVTALSTRNGYMKEYLWPLCIIEFIMYFCYSFAKGARPYKEVTRPVMYPNAMYAQPAYGVPVMVSPYQMAAPQPQYQQYQQYQQPQPQQTMQYAQYSNAPSNPPDYQSQVPNTQKKA